MCLFPLPNSRIDGVAYQKGVTHFDCGACPECLRKRASVWALRAVHESRDHAQNCMICLTYDQYLRDSSGKIVGERVSDFSVNKRDLQLFIKRLRKYFSDLRIKYIACAEYGKRTHRPHYHVLLFGVSFPDCVPYKRSKRGNLIYRSHILESLWKQGICTVDSLCINSASARYCTKYCAKDTRTDDTFMLFSHSIGLSSLITDFNGKSYIVEGREYPIPRSVWNIIISARYSHLSHEFDYRYVNNPSLKTGSPVARSLITSCLLNDIRRARFRRLRDDDPQYQAYLKYWHSKSLTFDLLQKTPFERISLLPDDKYHFYKVRAFEVLRQRSLSRPVPAPGSSCTSAYNCYFFYKTRHLYGRYIYDGLPYDENRNFHIICPIPSRPDRANDTKYRFGDYFRKRNRFIDYNKIVIFDSYGRNPFDPVVPISFFDSDFEKK